jgi:hypothetical protein
MTVEIQHPVVHHLSNRRLYQACGRVLDAVAEEVAEVRARTGDAGGGDSGWSGLGRTEEFELGLRDVAVGAAYQASLRTSSTVRQRSLADFLR